MVKKKITKGREIKPIDVKDQEFMIIEGIHPPYFKLSDFSKTDVEKMSLVKERRKSGRGFYNQKWGSHSKPYIPVYDKLILYVVGEKTRSIVCNQADIPEILARIKSQKKEVLKYKWNGREYQADEIPFWATRIKGGENLHIRSYAV